MAQGPREGLYRRERRRSESVSGRKARKCKQTALPGRASCAQKKGPVREPGQTRKRGSERVEGDQRLQCAQIGAKCVAEQSGKLNRIAVQGHVVQEHGL